MFRGDNSFEIIVSPSEKGLSLKGMYYSSLFFIFRVDRFSEVDWSAVMQAGSHKIYPPYTKMAQNQVYPISLNSKDSDHTECTDL